VAFLTPSIGGPRPTHKDVECLCDLPGGDRHADVSRPSTLNSLPALRNGHGFAPTLPKRPLDPARRHRRRGGISWRHLAFAVMHGANPGCLRWALGRDGAADGISGLTRGRGRRGAAASNGRPASKKALNKGPKWDNPRPDSSKSGPPSQNSVPFCSPPSIPIACLVLPPAAGCDRERFDAGGRENASRFRAQRQRAHGGEAMGQRGSAGAHFPSGLFASQPPGRVLLSCLRAGAGHRSRAWAGHGVFLRQGSCRKHALQSISRRFRPKLGRWQPGRRALKRGSVRKPTSVSFAGC